MATTESLLTDEQIDEATAQIDSNVINEIRDALKECRTALDTELQSLDIGDTVILQTGNDWLAQIRGLAANATEQ